MTIADDHDYRSVRAAGDLVLDGNLSLDGRGALTPGIELTIMRGRCVEGNFHALPEGRVLNTGGYPFKASFAHHSMTLTVMRAVPPTRPTRA